MNSFNLKNLSPITYDDIVEDDINTNGNMSVTLNKCVLARNAFFGAKLALLNFITDCEKLEEKLQTDISGADLHNIKDEYITYVNSLSSSMTSSLRQVYINSYIMNVDYPRYNPLTPLVTDVKSAKSVSLDYITINKQALKNINLLCYLPGIVIYTGRDYHLQIKFSEPDSLASDMLLQKNLGNLFKSRIKINPDIDKSFTIVGPINNYLEILNYEGPNAFESVDNARFFLTDIINYSNGISINCDIIRVLGYFDKLITNVEIAHRTVINAYKIHDISIEKFNVVKKKQKKKKCPVESSSSESSCDEEKEEKCKCNIKPKCKGCVCVNKAFGN
jgi:hypothetical protein